MEGCRHEEGKLEWPMSQNKWPQWLWGAWRVDARLGARRCSVHCIVLLCLSQWSRIWSSKSRGHNGILRLIRYQKGKSNKWVCLFFRSFLQSNVWTTANTFCIVFPLLLRNSSLPNSCTIPRPKIKRTTRDLVNAYLLLQNLSAMLDDARFDFTLTGSSSSNWKKVEETEDQRKNKSW